LLLLLVRTPLSQPLAPLLIKFSQQSRQRGPQQQIRRLPRRGYDYLRRPTHRMEPLLERRMSIIN
jgi:hypothetical protein